MKPNYFKIGVFVVIAFILILSAIVVFGSGLLTKEKLYFETYFDDSVSGLSIGAKEIEENLKQLVKRGLRLRLASNLLTGQAYLQGDYLDPNRYPVMSVPWDPEHFYIPSAPGELTTLKQSVDRILIRLEKIDTDKIGELIS
jgi:phospholipid/cholesterol/gamma-HCH transport system substrate-binding protein/paraquat-inducible protein B